MNTSTNNASIINITAADISMQAADTVASAIRDLTRMADDAREMVALCRADTAAIEREMFNAAQVTDGMRADHADALREQLQAECRVSRIAAKLGEWKRYGY